MKSPERTRSTTTLDPAFNEGAVGIDALRAMLDDAAEAPRESTDGTERLDNRTLSPTAAVIARIANILERRALEKSHGQALEEYRETNYRGYVDHLSNLADGPASSLQPSLQTEMYPQDEQEARMVERQQAFGQEELNYEDQQADREEQRIARAEMIDNGKKAVQKFGRAALRRLKDGLLTALGAGIIGGAAAAQGVRRGATSITEGIAARVDARRDRQAAERTQREQEAAAEQDRLLQLQAAENERRRQAFEEERRLAREEALRRAQEAAARKAARRAKWEKIKGNVVDAYETSRDTVKDRKAKLGRFALRARTVGAAGIDAAKEQWYNFEKDKS